MYMYTAPLYVFICLYSCVWLCFSFSVCQYARMSARLSLSIYMTDRVTKFVQHVDCFALRSRLHLAHVGPARKHLPPRFCSNSQILYMGITIITISSSRGYRSSSFGKASFMHLVSFAKAAITSAAGLWDEMRERDRHRQRHRKTEIQTQTET